MKRIILVTDRHVKTLPFFETAIKSLHSEQIEVIIFDQVEVEPNDKSWIQAIEFASSIQNVDGFVSLGGGSVIDTCKAMNLYTSCPPPSNLTPEEKLLFYTNKPTGAGNLPPSTLKPHISCPTTAGTGSESTGIAIYDLTTRKIKTGIAHRHLRPTMAIVDPIVTHYLPSLVCASAAFDVLSHALESFTAIPHNERLNVPRNPRERFLQRPMSQGSNIWADQGCLSALRLLGQSLISAQDETNVQAREDLMFASLLAGIAFGNAGVHMPHAMAYAVAGGIHDKHHQYENHHHKHGQEHHQIQDEWNRIKLGYGKSKSDEAFLPHGLSVILNAPSVFSFLAHTDKRTSRKCFEAATALGANGKDINPEDSTAVGSLLRSHLIHLMKSVHMPSGLSSVGYVESDIKTLASGTMQQQRLLSNLPKPINEHEMQNVFRGALKYW